MVVAFELFSFYITSLYNHHHFIGQILVKMHICEIVGNLDHNWWSNLDKKSATHVTATKKQQTTSHFTVPTNTKNRVGGTNQRYA